MPLPGLRTVGLEDRRDATDRIRPTLTCPSATGAGHEVTATTRTPGKVAQLREAGAEPVVVDGLDREAVIAAVRAANELRSRGTDNLLAAAERAGTRRVIAQRAERANERSGGPVKTEEDPPDSQPVPSSERTVAAVRHVEQTVPLAVPEGIVLRYGTFYGPGASDVLLDMLRERRRALAGGGYAGRGTTRRSAPSASAMAVMSGSSGRA
jgi:nucleoside-diphosphate-sugar epimerase